MEEESASANRGQSERRGTEGLEKGGLVSSLTGVGLRRGQQWTLADEMRLGLHGQVRRVWVPRGVKVRQVRQIVSLWRYLSIAVDPIRGELWWAWMNNMKKESVAEVVKGWREQGIKAIV